MKIAVIGAAGKAGSRIASECLSRGMDVTGIIRPSSGHRLPDGVKALEKDLFDLNTEDLAGFNAVVDAFGTASQGPGKEKLHVSSLRHLTEILEPLPEVRLLVVGGAGSLYTDGTMSRKVLEDIPEAFRAVPENMAEAFEELQKSGVNWTYFSPAASFLPDGERTGRYNLGRDIKILNSFGESMISYADYAIAMADEIEEAKFIRKRFTAVSDTSFSTDPAKKSLFDLAGGLAFTRRGAYFGIYVSPSALKRSTMAYQTSRLYIGTRRGNIPDPPNNGNDLFRIAPCYQGEKVGFAVHTSAEELTLTTAYGKIRICFADPSLMMIRGENGLGLKLEKNMPPHDSMRRRKGKAWEANFRRRCSLVLNPLKGDLDVKADWEWESFSTPLVRAAVQPDENGGFLLAVDESMYSGTVRQEYPSYEKALADVKADWESFLALQPELPEYPEGRRLAAYVTWSHLVDPSGLIKRPSIFMINSTIGSSWQMCFNAVTLKNDLPLAIELMLNQLDMQAPNGQLPDFYDDARGVYNAFKPPIQGWALEILMEQHDFSTDVPRDKLIYMYEGYVKWAEWFMKYRDDDQDGIPQYEHGDESGNDDSPLFKKHYKVELPDLMAFLALLYEKLGDIADILGRSSEGEIWKEKSKKLIIDMIRVFWNGERFVGRRSGTHEVVDGESLIFYRVLVLGHRLPQEIIDRMAEDLTEGNGYLTPQGLVSQRMTSREFNKLAFGNGGIIPPDSILVTDGLYRCGKVELAKKAAKAYCDGLIRPDTPYYPSAAMDGSWPASAFQILGDLYCNK